MQRNEILITSWRWFSVLSNHLQQVIGDKKAAQASRLLITVEGMEALNRLQQKLGIQLKFIHVIRNPFDNIATMTLRRAEEKKKGQESLKVKSQF